MTVRDFIKALGGRTAVSQRLGVRPQAISLWLSSEQIPLERVPALLRMAADRRVPVTAEDLRGDYDWEAVCGCRVGAE